MSINYDSPIYSLLLVFSWARNPGSSSSNGNMPSTVREHVLPLLQHKVTCILY